MRRPPWASAACLLLAGSCGATLDFDAKARRARTQAFRSAAGFQHHVWRDTPPVRSPGVFVAYVEIAAGDRDKAEYRMETNNRVVDRVLRSEIGGYPVNYGMIPGTLAFDGDPLDVLILGPRLTPGALYDVTVLAVMDMVDEKGPDPKIIAAVPPSRGKIPVSLTDAERHRLATWFNTYKRFEPHKWSRVDGWQNAAAARRIIERCRRFFAAGQ